MTPTMPSPVALDAAVKVHELIQRLGQIIARSPTSKRLAVMELLVDAMIEGGMKPGEVIELLNCMADEIMP